MEQTYEYITVFTTTAEYINDYTKETEDKQQQKVEIILAVLFDFACGQTRSITVSRQRKQLFCK